MATVIENTVTTDPSGSDYHHHFIGSHCCTGWNEMRSGLIGLNSCRMNFLQAIEPFRRSEWDLHDNMNVFQKVRLSPEDGKVCRPKRLQEEGLHRVLRRD